MILASMLSFLLKALLPWDDVLLHISMVMLLIPLVLGASNPLSPILMGDTHVLSEHNCHHLWCNSSMLHMIDDVRFCVLSLLVPPSRNHPIIPASLLSEEVGLLLPSVQIQVAYKEHIEDSKRNELVGLGPGGWQYKNKH